MSKFDPVKMTEGGVKMLMAITRGDEPDKIWDMLEAEGYSEEERVEVAKTVKAYMTHKNGDHSLCRGTCEESKKSPANPKADYSDDVKEEWK